MVHPDGPSGPSVFGPCVRSGQCLVDEGESPCCFGKPQPNAASLQSDVTVFFATPSTLHVHSPTSAPPLATFCDASIATVTVTGIENVTSSGWST